jgi:serine/threonine protein kinase
MSDLSEEYEFSQYKELNQLDKKNKVVVVQDIRDNRIWVRKNIEKRSLPVCEKMLGKKYSNLIYLHKIIKYQNNYYVLEEYINGENIQTIVSQKGKMDLETVRKIIVKICDGLTVLHKNGIIHRDITAKNIIIGVDGNVKIVDYGISRIIKDSQGTDTEILGTVGYAPPEQFGFLQTDIRTDIYSVGVLMNYMLTGALPQEVKYNGKMKNVLNICLNLRPEKRYSSAENLKKAVLHNYSARNDLFLLPGFRGDNNLVKIIALLIYMFYIFSSIIIVYAASIGNNIPQTIFALCFCIFTMGVSMLVFGDYTFYLERLFGLSDKGFWSKNLVRLFLTLVSIILSLILCVVMYYITEIMLSA